MKSYTTLKLAFIGLFALAVAVMWWYQLTAVQPKLKCVNTPGATWNPKTHKCKVSPEAACEQGGGWWDAQDKLCARVVSVPSVTGKPVGGR